MQKNKDKNVFCDILLSEQPIRYELCRKQVKNLNLRVRRDGSVFVSASPRVPISQIEAFLQSKSRWILRAVEMAKQACNSKGEQSYEEGDRFRLLGEEYSLHWLCGKGPSVLKMGDELFLTVSNKESDEAKKRTLTAYRDLVFRQTIMDICQKRYQGFAVYGISFPTVRFRNMRARWGSCCPRDGILTFNKRLAAYPVCCIEYVVVHEFVHFLQPDHSVRFYEWLQKMLPDWKERKAQLDSFPLCTPECSREQAGPEIS